MKSLSLLVLSGLCCPCLSWAATTEEITVPSKAMDKDMKVNIILPDSYGGNSQSSDSSMNRYPVVYLLHGHGDDQNAWPTRAPIPDLADRHQIIIVCPSGENTWYFDSYTNPKIKFDTYISKEVVPYVDKHFRTVSSRKGRAITGNSMGGHGALYLGARHPELFGAIGSLSGGVDLCPFPNNWNIRDNLGEYDQNKARWEKNSAVNFLPKTKKDSYRIIISCGTEDVFTQVNRNLDEALTKAGIKHEFLSSPGQHNWNYWKEAVKPQMEFFTEFFQSTGAIRKNAVRNSLPQPARPL